MALTQAEGTLMQAQLALRTAENTLENLKNSGDSLNLALINAEIVRDTAEINLNVGIGAVDFTAAQAELNRAKTWYDYVEDQLEQATENTDDWYLALELAKDRLDTAQANYDNVLTGHDSNQINLRKKQLEAAMLSLSGGVIGIIGGWTVSWLVSTFSEAAGFPIQSAVTADIVLLAIVVSVFIGLVSGVYPAMRAARLNPIDALHYE